MIGNEDPPFAGGSYVIVQKYLHDLTAWNELSTEEQERIVGRTKLADIELDDAVKPSLAHNALTKIEEDGKEIKIVRANMPFGQSERPNSAPTSSATHGHLGTIEQMLTNMFVGRPPGNYDRLLDFSRAVTGTLFFVPSTNFLEGVTGPARDRGAGRSAGRAEPLTLPRERQFARHRFAERRIPMNNLHRELAPISEAAWAQIEQEAARTLKRIWPAGGWWTFLCRAGRRCRCRTGHLRLSPGRPTASSRGSGRSNPWSSCGCHSSCRQPSTTWSVARTIPTGSRLRTPRS